MVWLPVMLLPTSNIVLTILSGADYDAHNVVLWVAGAVAEELFFRWFLLHRIFLRKLKPTHAILLVSILFAGMHLWNLTHAVYLAILSQMLFAFSFSIWAGAVLWRKGSILIPLLAHVLLNLTAVTEGTLIPMLVSAVVLADGILLLKGNENEQ